MPVAYEVPPNAATACPTCGNLLGFVFGTCCECGFNHLDNTFHFIKVAVCDLHPSDREWLVEKHRAYVAQRRN